MSGELIAYYLMIQVFLLDGTPITNSFTIPLEQGCDLSVADRYARQHVPIPEGQQIQDWKLDPQKLLWLCAPINRGTPGPALRPALYPGNTQASQHARR